jgi:hypothetical protein
LVTGWAVPRRAHRRREEDCDSRFQKTDMVRLVQRTWIVQLPRVVARWKIPLFRDKSDGNAGILPNPARADSPRTHSGLKGPTSIYESNWPLERYHSRRCSTFRSRPQHGRNLRPGPGTALGLTVGFFARWESKTVSTCTKHFRPRRSEGDPRICVYGTRMSSKYLVLGGLL